MGAGKRRHLVTIERPRADADVTVDGHIDFSDDASWEAVVQRYAAIKPRTGGEFERAEQTEATLTHRIEMLSDRVTREIKTTWRIRYGSRRFEIIANRNIEERDKEQHLDCMELMT